jgi:DMSO/TMAO reductase YedYZ heme-binding membrane subunit
MDQAMHPLALLVVGLFAFFYGTLHLLTYVIADRLAGLEFQNGVVAWTTLIGIGGAVWDDISKRKYITVGFTAWAAMVQGGARKTTRHTVQLAIHRQKSAP